MKAKRIRITHVHKEDACYDSKEKYIGLTGLFERDTPNHEPGYYPGRFYPDNKKVLTIPSMYFFAIRYKNI